MAKVPILIALLPQLLCMLLEVSGQSQCQYFTYTIDPTTDDVTGQIQIPSPPKKVELHLVVTLSVAIALPTKYVGQLELAQSKEESVRIVEQGRPLLYYLRFPVRRPIPLLTGIWFNNRQYCSGPRATGQIVTSIRLEHTLYPPNALPLSQSIYPNDSLQNPITNFLPTFWPAPQPTPQPAPQPIPQPVPQPIPQLIPQPAPQPEPAPVYTNPPVYTLPSTNRPIYNTQRPPNQPIYNTQRPPNQSIYNTQRPTKKPTLRPTTISSSDGIGYNPFFNPPAQQNNHYDCGISTHRDNINLLISGGIKTSPGQWPWLAAIFIVKLEYEFQCAGSILTNKHVITAAHCFKLDRENIPSSTIVISLGRYQLREWREPGSVNREITKYVLHPDYLHQESGDSDLAIAILRTPVEFSLTIKPICMWFGSVDLQSAINKIGYVVGWGRDEFGNAYLAEPRMAKMPIVSQETCLWSHSSFVSFTSNRTFCAGARDGSGPCNGDSGSGLILRDATTGRYQLRGIVSRSLYDRERMTCDLEQYVVFVDVAKYLSWIQQQISNT